MKMRDLIERQDAIIQLSHNKNGNDDCDVIIQKDIETIKQLPSAQPERKKGEWVEEYWNGEHTRKCSACNITQTVTTYREKVNFNYCPYCGADMKGEQNG